MLKETSRTYFIQPRFASIPDEVDIAIGKTRVLLYNTRRP